MNYELKTIIMKRELTKDEKAILKSKKSKFNIALIFSIILAIITFSITDSLIIAPILLALITICCVLYFKMHNYKAERELGPDVRYRKNCQSIVKKNNSLYSDYLKFFNFMRLSHSYGERATFESFLAGHKENLCSFIDREKNFKSTHQEVKTDFFEIVKLYPSVPEGIVGEA